MILLDEIDLMNHLRSLFSIDAKSLAFFYDSYTYSTVLDRKSKVQLPFFLHK